MTRRDQINMLIAQLDRMTMEGRLKWSAVDVPPRMLHGTDDIVPVFFETEYMGKPIAVFEKRYRGYDGERDMPYWTSSLHFAVLDDERNVLFETVHSPAVNSLRNTISEQVSGVDDLLDNLLQEDSPFG